MSEEEMQAKNSARIWVELTRQANLHADIPVAVIGAKKVGGKYYSSLYWASVLPKAAVLSVLKEIVEKLEREEQGNGQRVS